MNMSAEPMPEFSITRRFDAPREMLWRAWTQRRTSPFPEFSPSGGQICREATSSTAMRSPREPVLRTGWALRVRRSLRTSAMICSACP